MLLGVEPARPSYARLVELLKTVPNTRASRSWVDRVLDINNLKGAFSATLAGPLPISIPCATFVFLVRLSFNNLELE